MSLGQIARSALPLIIGLVVGGAGVTLFSDSLPGEKGTPEARIQRLEHKLKQADNRIAELAAADATGQNRFGEATRRNVTDGVRGIGAKMRAGHQITPDDILHATKPLIRDLAPLFDRVRIREERRVVDRLSGEIARKYDLSPEQQKTVAVWFEKRAQEEARRWTELLGREDTGFEQIIRASHNVRPDDGLDQFMQGVLPAEKFAAFKTDRINERAERLQRDTDAKVQRVDGIVGGLSDTQRDQLFATLARNSRDYDPAMAIEGTTGQLAATKSTNPREAMLGILTPDQRMAYDAAQRRRREEAEKDLNAIGMTLPPNWEALEDEDFR